MKKKSPARAASRRRQTTAKPGAGMPGGSADPVVLRFAANGLTPVAAFLALGERVKGACLLESAAENDVAERVSLIALEPEFRLVSDSGRTHVEGLHGPPLLPGESPFAWLRRVLAARISTA